MPRDHKNPKRHIVSCRVDAREHDILKALAENAGTDLSSLLRKSLERCLAQDKKKQQRSS